MAAKKNPSLGLTSGKGSFAFQSVMPAARLGPSPGRRCYVSAAPGLFDSYGVMHTVQHDDWFCLSLRLASFVFRCVFRHAAGFVAIAALGDGWEPLRRIRTGAAGLVLPRRN